MRSASRLVAAALLPLVIGCQPNRSESETLATDAAEVQLATFRHVRGNLPWALVYCMAVIEPDDTPNTVQRPGGRDPDPRLLQQFRGIEPNAVKESDCESAAAPGTAQHKITKQPAVKVDLGKVYWAEEGIVELGVGYSSGFVGGQTWQCSVERAWGRWRVSECASGVIY